MKSYESDRVNSVVIFVFAVLSGIIFFAFGTGFLASLLLAMLFAVVGFAMLVYLNQSQVRPKNDRQDSAYPIRPSDINATRHLFDAFGHYETEISAVLLVGLAQENGDWRDFTKAEIDEFSGQDFYFNRLTSSGKPPIKKNGDGTFSFTHEFIARCFQVSPANNQVI
ncbi:MAG: hypothetical protein WCT16_02905 [Candidatus Buchananbacteria bacterium]